jgi:hypothetical protein
MRSESGLGGLWCESFLTMKKKNPPTVVPIEPNEDDIRAYAYHLYEQAGCIAGRELENWLEARACLLANIPRHESHTRLHRQLQPKRPGTLTAFTVPNPEAHNLAS